MEKMMQMMQKKIVVPLVVLVLALLLASALIFVVYYNSDTGVRKRQDAAVAAEIQRLVDSGEIPADTTELTVSNYIDNIELEFSNKTLSVPNNGRGTFSNLQPLQALTNLQRLYLGGNDFNDITPLLNLKNLTFLVLPTSRLTQEQIDELQTAFPNCYFFYV